MFSARSACDGGTFRFPMSIGDGAAGAARSTLAISEQRRVLQEPFALDDDPLVSNPGDDGVTADDLDGENECTAIDGAQTRGRGARRAWFGRSQMIERDGGSDACRAGVQVPCQ